MENRGQHRYSLRELCEEVKLRIDYRAFFLRYCVAEPSVASAAKGHLRCPIPSHGHSGQGSSSLSLDFRRGLFHCFSREEGGDAIRFYELMHGVAFPQAVREMARELGITATAQGTPAPALRAAPDKELADELTAQEPLAPLRLAAICESFLEACRREEQMEGVNYLARRGISAAAMKQAGVAYFPRRAYRRVMRWMLDRFKLEELQQSGLFNEGTHLTFYKHRLLFPFYMDERAIYLQGRTTASGVEPRWHNMRGAVPSLYNVDALARLPSGTRIYLVEGFTDTLTLMTHGFMAVGLVGAGGFKEEWLAPLARFRVIAALDGDRAGERASERYQELFARRGLRLAQVRLATDVNDFFRQHPAAAVEFALLTEAALERVEQK